MCFPSQAFRKAIGVRIKEETEILEGEVRLTVAGLEGLSMHAVNRATP